MVPASFDDKQRHQAARFHPLPEKPRLCHTGRIALGLDVDG